MCFGGSSSSSGLTAADEPPAEYAARGATTMEQAQLMAQQDIENQNVALQTAIANQQEEQAQESLAYTEYQNAQSEAEAQAQADLQSQYDTSRNQLAQQASDWIDQTFGQYDQNYYNQYAQNYMNALTPEVDRQYGTAQGSMLFGLARQGQLNSQTHADQQGILDETRGRAYSDIATEATQAAQNLQQQIGQQKDSLLSQILSTGALGQPTSPGSIDDVNSSIDTTNRAINQIQTSAQDQLAKYGQLPTSSSLGNIFGSLSTAASNYTSGLNAYTIGSTGGYGSGGVGTGPSSPGLG